MKTSVYFIALLIGVSASLPVKAQRSSYGGDTNVVITAQLGQPAFAEQTATTQPYQQGNAYHLSRRAKERRSWPVAETNTVIGIPAPASAYGEQSGTSLFTPYERQENDFLVYPHPVVDNTNIALGFTTVGKARVIIIDMNGAVRANYKYEERTNTLAVDMSLLPPGLYSVRVSGEDFEERNLKVFKR